jgi:mRNA interferase MazF
MCKRFEIYYADLSPVKGSEQGGMRPVVILQNDVGNRHSPTTIVACVTSKIAVKHKIPTHIEITTTDESGLAKDSMVLLEQIRTIDKSRLKRRIGVVNETADRISIEKGLKVSLGL